MRQNRPKSAQFRNSPPTGVLRSVVAESLLMRQQVVILNRGRKRAPNLRALDRIIAGFVYLNDAPGPGPAIRHRA
jgi:hypothetical protein